VSVAGALAHVEMARNISARRATAAAVPGFARGADAPWLAVSATAIAGDSRSYMKKTVKNGACWAGRGRALALPLFCSPAVSSGGSGQRSVEGGLAAVAVVFGDPSRATATIGSIACASLVLSTRGCLGLFSAG
jgi:hypothetical protein